MTLVRIAEKRDAEDIQHVFHATWLVTYSNSETGITTEDIETHFKNAHTKESLARIRKHIGSMPDNSKIFVAELFVGKKGMLVC